MDALWDARMREFYRLRWLAVVRAPRRETTQARWDARRAQREAKALLAECVEPAAGKTGGRL